jgi:DNA polymerase-3 subunit alpha
MEEWPATELQAREKAVLGHYISSHPLAQYSREIAHLSSHLLGDKDEFADGIRVRICGVLAAIRQRQTRQGDRMAVVTIEDLTGAIEALVFPSAYQQYQAQIREDNLVGVAGRISRQDSGEEPKLRVDEVIPLDMVAQRWGQALRIELPSQMVNTPLVERLGVMLSASPGSCPLLIDLTYPGGAVRRLRVGKFRVQPAPELIRKLSDLFGAERVVLSG